MSISEGKFDFSAKGRGSPQRTCLWHRKTILTTKDQLQSKMINCNPFCSGASPNDTGLEGDIVSDRSA